MINARARSIPSHHKNNTGGGDQSKPLEETTAAAVTFLFHSCRMRALFAPLDKSRGSTYTEMLPGQLIAVAQPSAPVADRRPDPIGTGPAKAYVYSPRISIARRVISPAPVAPTRTSAAQTARRTDDSDHLTTPPQTARTDNAARYDVQRQQHSAGDAGGDGSGPGERGGRRRFVRRRVQSQPSAVLPVRRLLQRPVHPAVLPYVLREMRAGQEPRRQGQLSTVRVSRSPRYLGQCAQI